MKTEMVSITNSSVIGGNLVQLDNKNRYHVTDKNGRKKILTKDQFDKNVNDNIDKIKNNEEFEFKKQMSTTQKTIFALGTIGVISAIFYHKNILKFFKNLKSSESGKKIEKGIKETINTVSEAVSNPKTTAEKVGDAAKNLTEKGTTAILSFLDKTSNFLKGFKK